MWQKKINLYYTQIIVTLLLAGWYCGSQYQIMPRKCILEDVFSITHYLPRKKKTDGKGSHAATNTNLSTEIKFNTANNKVNDYAQTNLFP